MKLSYPSAKIQAALRYLKPVGVSENAYIINGHLIRLGAVSGKYRLDDSGAEHEGFSVELPVLERLSKTGADLVFTMGDDAVKVKAGKSTATLKQTRIPPAVATALLLEPADTKITLPNATCAKVLKDFTGQRGYASVIVNEHYLMATNGVSAAVLPIHTGINGLFPVSLISEYGRMENPDDELSALSFTEKQAYISNQHGVIGMGYGAQPNYAGALLRALEVTSGLEPTMTMYAADLYQILQPWAALANEDVVRLRSDDGSEAVVEIETKGSMIEESIPATTAAGVNLVMNAHSLQQYLKHFGEDEYFTIYEGPGFFWITPSGELPCLLTSQSAGR